MCRRWPRSIVFLAAIPALAFGQSSSKDDIWLKGRAGTTSGKIQSVTRDHITIGVSGSSQEVPVETILKLRLSDDPTGMAAVRASVQSGRFDHANTQLQSVKVAGRPVTRQELEFHRALVASRLALQGTGTVKDAARMVAAFISRNPTSFRYYEACELMGDLAMGLGRFDSAAKYYGKISQAKAAALAAKGKLLQGEALFRLRDFAQAASLFKQTAAATDPRLRSMGEVGLAMCVVERGRPGEAIEQVERVIQENPSTDVELFARAYNALGKAYAASGQKEAALDAYLHTALLFYGNREAHAEALYHLVKLWSDVNEPSEAQQARKTLQTRYASSPWAKK